MFIQIKVLALILCSISRGMDGIFVEVGKLEDKYVAKGINEAECGLTIEPKHYTIEQNKGNCFVGNYPNKNLSIIYHSTDYERKLQEERTASRVSHGRPSQWESPWTVYLLFKWWNTSISDTKPPNKYYNSISCTGVLITMEWILTSAHCLPIDYMKNLFTITIYATEGGHIGINFNEVDMAAERKQRKVIYPNDNFFHPLAQEVFKRKRSFLLLKSWQKFTRNIERGFYKINTVCLPNKLAQLNTEYEGARFAGYGYLSNVTGGDKNRITLAEVLLEPAKKCTPEGMLCTNYAEYEPRTCDEGDLGGPLTQFSADRDPRAVLIGILETNKWLVNDKCSDTTGSDTWIPTFSTSGVYEWILDTILNN